MMLLINTRKRMIFNGTSITGAISSAVRGAPLSRPSRSTCGSQPRETPAIAENKIPVYKQQHIQNKNNSIINTNININELIKIKCLIVDTIYLVRHLFGFSR